MRRSVPVLARNVQPGRSRQQFRTTPLKTGHLPHSSGIAVKHRSPICVTLASIGRCKNLPTSATGPREVGACARPAIESARTECGNKARARRLGCGDIAPSPARQCDRLRPSARREAHSLRLGRVPQAKHRAVEQSGRQRDGDVPSMQRGATRALGSIGRVRWLAPDAPHFPRGAPSASTDIARRKL